MLFRTKSLFVPKSYMIYCCLFIITTGILAGCKSNQPLSNEEYGRQFYERVLSDTSDFYYFDFNTRENVSSTLPIGVFDSGTGGLTVLDALINYDNFDNTNQKFSESGDGIKDFLNEQFIYFGDQANMPYGNYSEVNKTSFLKELILKDVLFLLGNKYYRTPEDKDFQTDKSSVKLIVIACNTATAYGKNAIEVMLKDAGSRMKVIGVIDAGVRGALSTFDKEEDGTIAVMATAGTISSNGYLNTFIALKETAGYSGDIAFIQQAGAGIAEAIDEEPDFIDRNASEPRDNYKGPSDRHENLKIQNELIPMYNFDTTSNSFLNNMKGDVCHDMQLNSPENYLRYYLVSLCEQLRIKNVKKPLKTVILGCTHYPFYSDFIQSTLKELYDLKVNDSYTYREFLSDSITLIDPAINTAKEVYEYLSLNQSLNKSGEMFRSEFYISVPDYLNPEIKKDEFNRFTYAYKYGRDPNHFYDTKQVPVSRANTSEEIIKRIRMQIPEIYGMIQKFNTENEKTTFLKPEEQF